MLFRLQIFLMILALSIMGVSIYQFKYESAAQPWKNYAQPQLAAHSSLEQEASILQELEHKKRFAGYKTNNVLLLNKANIFNSIQP